VAQAPEPTPPVDPPMVRGAPAAGAPGARLAAVDERATGVRLQPPVAPAPRRSAPEPTPRRDARRETPPPPPVGSAVATSVKGSLVTVRAPGRRGAGFVVDSSGYVVTSRQMVSGNGKVEVTLPDGRTPPVTVVAQDPLSDVAVLKLDASGLSPVALGSSSGLRIGDPVVAVGLRRGSEVGAAVGTVNATGSATGGDLALDVPPGSHEAGSPLLNARGEVIGVATGRGVGGVRAGGVPIDRVKSLLRTVSAVRRPGAGGGTTSDPISAVGAGGSR
jgi:S1-C subfamily serine protease